MPRPKLQRQPCDCLDCRDPRAAPSPAPSAAAAAARQDPPPKSLVVCVQGALEPARSTPLAGHPHLDAAVRDGWSGLLACRSGGPALPLQLLGILQQDAPPAAGLLPDRFKQLRAGLLTDSADVECAGKLAGCYFTQRLPSIPGSSSEHAWPPAEQLAARIADLLSVQPLAGSDPVGAAAPAVQRDAQGRSEEQDSDDVIDMVILVLDAANTPQDDADLQAGSEAVGGSGSEHALEWVDGLLRRLNLVPGFRDSVLLSLVLTKGCQGLGRESPDQEQQQQVLHPNSCNGSPATDFMPVRRPLQSHQAAGLQPVATDASGTAVVVHRLAGVIRVDRATALDPDHIAAKGGAGCILAERFLHEVAYKLGRAAKYGA